MRRGGGEKARTSSDRALPTAERSITPAPKSTASSNDVVAALSTPGRMYESSAHSSCRLF